MVLIEGRNIYGTENHDEFPSPYGDYGSYHSPKHLTLHLLKVMFPSPYGDYGSYLFTSTGSVVLAYRFRPLTGIMVLIKEGTLWNPKF